MQHIPGAARCRGIVGLVFGHRFDPLMTVRTDSGTDGGSQVREDRVYADGAVCCRCGAAVLFYGGDDSDDDDDPPMDVSPPQDADDQPAPTEPTPDVFGFDPSCPFVTGPSCGQFDGVPVMDGEDLRTVH